jgi:thiamine biosynthesis lipoprotein
VFAAEAMRTRFEIVLADERDPHALRAAAEEAFEEIARVEADLSAFRRDAVLAEINADAALRPVQVDGAVFGFFARAAALSEALEGAFDPTVGAVLELLRSGEGDEQLRARAQARVGFAREVRLDAEARTIAFAEEGVRLDAGAIAKGYALERAAQILRDAGVTRALLHGGTSSVYGLGAPPDAEGWTVALQDPVVVAGRLARVVLRDQALGVSAIHGRTFRTGEERVGHVIDPRTGASVAHTLLAAVVSPSATDADAMSTALLVLGAEALPRLAARFPDTSLLVAPREAPPQTSGPAFLAMGAASGPE